MASPNSFIPVNVAANPGKKLATYEYTETGLAHLIITSKKG